MDESSDGEINWPKSFKPILKGGSKYFVIDESFLLALGVKVHVKQRGFKDLDHILERHDRLQAESSYTDLEEPSRIHALYMI